MQRGLAHDFRERAQGERPLDEHLKKPIAAMHVAKAKGKITFVGRPAANWHVKARAKVKPRPIKVKWYVRPEAPKAKVLFGVKATGKVRTVLGVRPAKPRVAGKVRFEGGIGVRDHRSKIGGDAAGTAGVPMRRSRHDAKR